jgi:Trypsin-like peptidase domain/Effector-associated domain 1
MQLTGPQALRLSEALRDAFSPQSFQRMLLFMLNRKVADLAGPGDAQEVVFEVIAAFNAEDQVELLIAAARQAAPTNTKLYAFSQQFGLGSTRQGRQELERIVRDTNSFLDPDRFRSRLGALEKRVGRVEIETVAGLVSGTAFLVSDDVVMTNHHVVASLLKGGQTLGNRKALVRFDYRKIFDTDGALIATNPGRTSSFTESFLVDSSPSTAEGKTPRDDELDYALVRLADSVGQDVLDNGANTTDPPKRGFIAMPQNAADFAKDSSLFILQHPRGAPLKLALETKSVLGLFDSGLRVRYTTNTEPGSSGSPCFTPDWELAALHRSGDPDFDPQHNPSYNEGIPMSAIVALIEKHGQSAALGKSGE